MLKGFRYGPFQVGVLFKTFGQFNQFPPSLGGQSLDKKFPHKGTVGGKVVWNGPWALTNKNVGKLYWV